jgi:3-methyladenine DNA glycosylase AlkD
LISNFNIRERRFPAKMELYHAKMELYHAKMFLIIKSYDCQQFSYITY